VPSFGQSCDLGVVFVISNLHDLEGERGASARRVFLTELLDEMVLIRCSY